MDAPVLIRRVNLVLTAIGTALFALVLAYVNLAPEEFGAQVKVIVVSKTSDQVSTAFAERGIAVEVPNAGLLSQPAAEAIRTRIDEMQQGLDAGLDRAVANVLAAACKIDCDRREDAAAAARAFIESSIAGHGMAADRIEQLILGKYEKVINELRTDLNIFAGSNAILLALSFILSLFKREAAHHLLPISAVLTASTILMAIWYLLGQNWVMAVVFGDYWGWSYPLMQMLLAALLIDIALNAGRITTRIFNRVLDLVGSSIQLVPC